MNFEDGMSICIICKGEGSRNMSAKTDTEVIIDGKVFTISGYESEEYLQKVASYKIGRAHV